MVPPDGGAANKGGYHSDEVHGYRVGDRLFSRPDGDRYCIGGGGGGIYRLPGEYVRQG